MTERQAAAAAEAKKLKYYTLSFWVVIALVVCIFVGALTVTPIKNVMYKNTDAIQVGDHTLTSVELNYFYTDSINNYYSNIYSSYYMYIYYGLATMDDLLGFSTTKSLAKQDLTEAQQTSLGTEAETWADYFMETTAETIKTIYALYDLALEKNHKLTDDEQEDLDESITSLKKSAANYSSVDAYLRSVYGNGATEESYVAYLTVSTYATSYYTAYSDALEFDADELLDYWTGKEYAFSSYTFSSYYLVYSKFYAEDAGTEDEDGNKTYTEAEKAAAIAACKKAADDLAAGNYETLADFNKAIQELDKSLTKKDTSTAAATEIEKTLFTSNSISSLFKDWLSGRELKSDAEADKYGNYDYDDYTVTETRKEGDMTVIESASGEGDDKVINGYYVLRFESQTNNDFLLKNVRHILIKCEGTEQDDGSIKFSDEDAAKKAKETAEKILAEFEEGKITEGAFEDLCEKYLEDKTASEAKLYEDVYPGQMVSQFEDWCFDDNRNAGDYGIVETKYGYHIMFFVGNSETNYRDSLVEDALHDETVNDWLEELAASISYTELSLANLKVKL